MSHHDEITDEQIVTFVKAWYEALDFHVPFDDAYTFLTTADDLSVQFPDGDIRDRDSFKAWYDRVTNLFFDENHYVQTVDIDRSGDTITLDIVVGWQASWWEPPAAKSKRTSMDATQRWTVRPSDRNSYGLEIVSYNATVAPFNYAPGFARL